MATTTTPEPHIHVHEHKDPPLGDLPINLRTLPRFFLLLPIRGYQKTFSRVLPVDTCRYYPTCSHYGYQSIFKYGIIKGSWMAVTRVLRCNPFSKGGYDPVP